MNNYEINKNFHVERIILCRGNEGQQLYQQNLFQIRLYQLEKINKESILKLYTKSKKQSIIQPPVNLVTKNRNYLIDILLSKNIQLISNQNEQIQKITQSKVQLPLELQVIFPDLNFVIQSNTEVDIRYFNILKKIGQGTFAQIFLAQQKYDRALVIIKRINKTQHLEKGSKQMLLNQYKALKQRYQHKVNLLYMFQNEQFIYFVMDYCVYGDLYKLILQQKRLTTEQVPQCEQCDLLTKQQKYQIWLQIAFMIVYMHQKGFIYRDLKPENILIDQNGFVKLCDFGYCTKFQKNQTFKDLCGTLEYIPPELINGDQYDKTIDLYGLGILLYELIANTTPFEGITMENMRQIKSKDLVFNKKTFSPLQISLIQNLTHKFPSQRLGSSNSMKIFKHPFFDSPQVLKLIKNIINKKVDYHFVFKLKFNNPKQVQRRKQFEGQHRKFFDKSYNYLTPAEQIQQKIGPKFNSGF